MTILHPGSPRNRSKYTSLGPRPHPYTGKWVWCTCTLQFERFLGLDDVAVLISGAPIRFTACDFSCDSAPAAQMRPQCCTCCMRDPHTRQCVAMTIISITCLFCILEAQEIARSTPDPFPRVGIGSGNETRSTPDPFPRVGIGSGNETRIDPALGPRDCTSLNINRSSVK